MLETSKDSVPEQGENTANGTGGLLSRMASMNEYVVATILSLGFTGCLTGVIVTLQGTKSDELHGEKFDPDAGRKKEGGKALGHPHRKEVQPSESFDIIYKGYEDDARENMSFVLRAAFDTPPSAERLRDALIRMQEMTLVAAGTDGLRNVRVSSKRQLRDDDELMISLGGRAKTEEDPACKVFFHVRCAGARKAIEKQ